MIDYASIKSMMSMTTIMVGFIAVLIIGAVIVEISDGMAEKRRKKLSAKRKANTEPARSTAIL